MSQSLLELVELPNGDIALKRVDSEEDQPEAIVTLRFSKESLLLMQESKMVIAQAMIEAGMAAYSDLLEEEEADKTDMEEGATEEVTFH